MGIKRRADERMGMATIQRLALLLIGVITVFVYGNSLDNSFHYDDLHSIVKNPHVRSIDNLAAFFYDSRMFSEWGDRGMYRPMVLVSYALNYAAGEGRVAGYHLVNLLLHLFSVFAVFAVGRAVGAAPFGALLAAFIFALHPVNGEAVNYISSRSESLVALCYLISLYAYLRWRQVGPPSGPLFYGLSVVAFTVGMMSKSIALTLPGVLLLLEFLSPRAKRTATGWRTLMRWHLPYWVIVAGYLIVIRDSAGMALGEPVRGYPEQILTQLKALIYYGHLLISPVTLSVEHQFFTASSGSGIAVLSAALVLGSVVWMIVGSRWRDAALPLGAAALSLLPTLVVPLHVLVNEHRLYLALGLICALGVARWGTSRHQLVYALVAICLVFGLMSYQRNPVWTDELTLWQDAVDKAPEMYRAHMHLGGAYQADAELYRDNNPAEQYKALVKARASHQRAVRLAPHVAEAHYNLGNVLREIGQVRDAVYSYQKSLALAPGFVPVLLNLGLLIGDLGEREEAIELLSRGLRESPERVSFHYGLGKNYDALGDGAAAVRHYTTYVESDQALPGVAEHARRRLRELAGKSLPGTSEGME